MEEEKVKKHRISGPMGALLFGTALMTDVLEGILEWMTIGFILNPFIEIFMTLAFWLWFMLLGVGFGSTKRALTAAAVPILEIFLPGTDAAVVGAFWTIGIIVQLIMIRFEDMTGAALPLPGKTPKIDISSARDATLSGGNKILNRQNMRRETVGQSRPDRVRPTLDSSRKNTMATMRKISTRRSAMDIKPPNSSV